LTSTETALPPAKEQRNLNSISRRQKIGAFVLILSIVGLLSYFANSELHRSSRTATPIVLPPGDRIRVEVLNGAGGIKVAQRVADELRAAGIDVVEIGNYKSTTVEHTIVIDRFGSHERAKSVALKLRLSESRIVQQIDKSLFIDVSVVVGKDYFTRISLAEEK
jgi:hypothetical protein